jgi:phosphoribosylamine--glycine ligase
MGRDIADGLMKKVPAWEPYVDWSDLIIFDDSCFGKTCDELRAKGKAVVGGSEYSDRLEMERGFGQEEFKKAGMTVVPDWTFKSMDEAINFVKKNPGRYVIKPDGKTQDEKALTYVGKDEDGADVISQLESYKKKWAGKIKEIEVQTFIKGVEIAIGGFFNGEDFIQPSFLNTEYKKLMDGDVGPNCGEAGETACWIDGGRIYEETLAKMAAPLRANHYTGYFDLNLIATKEALYPLEATARYGFPPIWLQMDSIESKLGDFHDAMANGKDFDLKVKPGYIACVVVAVPPYPFDDQKGFDKYAAGKKIEFHDPKMGGIYMSDAKKIGNDWVIAGNCGYVAICIGCGMTMHEAKEEAYKRVKTIEIPDMFYRTDIGHKWHKDRDLLQAWGWL